MKMRHVLALPFALLFGFLSIPVSVSYGQSRPDPLGEVMVPPQAVLQHADELGLDARQKEFVQSQVRQMREKYPELQGNLQREVAALGELLREEHPDEQKALAQLDKVLEGERQIKRAQLQLSLAIRGELTPHQQARLRDLRPKLMAEAPGRGGAGPQAPEALRAKVQQVQELARKLRDEGKDPSAVRSLMEQVQPLARDGKFQEAEELVDRALKELRVMGGAPATGAAPAAGAASATTGPTAPTAGGAAPIDWDRARTLYQRERNGEALTPDERAYLDRAKAERMQQGRPGANAPGQGAARGPMAGRPAITGQESTGLVPLTQLKGDARYKGQDGGLYGAGSNQPPDAQAKLAREAAAKVVPLDAAGNPAPNGKDGKGGKVVLMSIGMSNTTAEFSRFKQVADADPEKSPSVLIVDGAQGGKDAAAWADVGDGTTNATWEEADRRIKAAGATPRQVQVVWIKQALAGPSRLGDFPASARALQEDLEKILAVAKARYPNLKLAYLSSRIYAGYAVTMLNPEPYAYEGAFAVRWVVEDQIKGEAKLNADPAKGEVKAPVVLWGPYLWADGTKGREGDDLVYRREDLSDDGTHPSPGGRQKVAELLLKFLKTDPTAAPWFTKGKGGEPPPQGSHTEATPAAPAAPAAPAGPTAPTAPTAPAEAAWSRDDAAHLLRRAGFGGTPQEIDRLHTLGRRAAVEYLLSGSLPPGAEAPFARSELGPFVLDPGSGPRPFLGPAALFQVQKLKVWTLDRMVRGDRPLVEKMTLFWHGLFTSGFREVRDVRLLAAQDALFRREAVGNYRRLTHAVVHDGATLRYLNNDENVSGHPNENLARELMELFTMGEGNGYTEADIPEVARALTGMTVARRPGADAEFDPSRHDDGLKTIFGRSGDYLPDDVPDLIFERPEPAAYLARRLWVFFGTPEPSEQDVAPVADALRSGGWELAPALRALFNSPAFYDDRCKFSIIKSPVELEAMTLRLLAESQPRVLWASALGLRELGQDLFQPPNVKGWPGGERWITSGTVTARYALATAAANGRLGAGLNRGPFGGRSPNAALPAPPAPGTRPAAPLDPQAAAIERRQAALMAAREAEAQKVRAELAQLPALPPADEVVVPARLFPELGKNPPAVAVVDSAAARFLQRPLPPAKKSALVESLGPEPLTIGEPATDERVRQMLGLLMSTPEYQVE